MTAYICATCGTQFAKSIPPPESCPLCEDDRQYVGYGGQAWTTQDELGEHHANRISEIEKGLFGIGTEPRFGIGQRALLVQSPHGNLLWDCVSLLDERTVDRITKLGGISSIAVSHPHFYGSVVEWADAFNATVYLNGSDRDWVMRPSSRIQFWDEETLEIQPDIRIIRAGGHFPGSSVCLWAGGADGAGALLTGDTIHVAADRNWVSFMHSFPNLIPLPARKVTAVAAAVADLRFDRLYGGWWGHCVSTGANGVVARSASRYISAIS